MAVWRHPRPRRTSRVGVAAGLALFVPDSGRAGQADGLAPGGEPLVLSGEATGLKYQSNGGGDSQV